MTTKYRTFAEVRARLDEIVAEVRKKDLPLEKSLDLYEEAIELGNRCAELVDKPDFTEEEAQAARLILSEAAEALEGADAGQGVEDEPAAAADVPTEADAPVATDGMAGADASDGD